jgi:PAS domain S-box-containing protein
MLLRRRGRFAFLLLMANLAGLAAFGVWLVVAAYADIPSDARLMAFLVGAALLINAGICAWTVHLRKNAPVYEEAFVSLILDSVDAAITVYNSDGKLLRANKGAERLSGFSQAELYDPDTWRHILGTDFEHVDRIVSGRRADDYPILNENYWISRDGTRRLLRWSNVALKDPKGHISLVVCIGFDITEQRRFEADLIMTRNDAELANRAKSDFLANMSHELRTPLNAILGFSEIIRDQRLGIDPDVYRNYAVDIFDSGQLLLQLINDILDMAKLESGRVDLEEREIDLPAVIALSQRLVERKATEGRVQLAIDIAVGLPPLLGGERALKQIVLNLLSNAVKFTPPDGEAKVTARVNAQGGLEIVVSDSGIGIPANSLEKLFQPFYQVDAKVSRRYGGTGLGLAITKKLVEAHDGQIAVSSRPNQGTSVIVSFPPRRTLKV